RVHRPPASPLFPYTTLFRSFFLGAEAVGGHITAISSATSRVPAILAQGAHLAAAAMWVGGLGVLAWALLGLAAAERPAAWRTAADRKSTRLNSSHRTTSYAV